MAGCKKKDRAEGGETGAVEAYQAGNLFGFPDLSTPKNRLINCAAIEPVGLPRIRRFQ